MADIYWKSPTVSLTSYLTTTLNSLANDTLDLGAEINNETNLALYVDLELTLASLDLSAQTNPSVEVYLIESVDGGTDFETVTDGSSTDATHPPSDKLLCTFGLREGSGAEAKLAIKSMLLIPPGRFKLAMINRTGVAFASSGNVLAYRTYRMQSA